MAKKSRGNQLDLSSFMCIILMLIGTMIIILVANVVVIISNPENIRITSIIQTGLYTRDGSQEMTGPPPFPFGNKYKEPSYVDVHRGSLVVYPGGEVVSLRDMERRDNALERLLADVSSKKDEEYIVLLARPGTAAIVHRLKKIVLDRGIDLGFELFEEGRPVDYDRVARASGKQR